MVSDIKQLFDDYQITYQTEGHKHCRPGWINMSCPFCSGNPGMHLGFTKNGKIAYCWRCGWHPVSVVIAKLLNIRIEKAKDLLLQYVGTAGKEEAKNKKTGLSPLKYPSGTQPLQKQHETYLLNRGFDPHKIEKEWGILGTGPVSILDGINYSHRILAPIYWGNKIVSFQTRDVTGKSSKKYLACPQKREEMEHQSILYGKNLGQFDVGICVEGITDVWRLGDRAFAIFGIEYSHSQVRLIANLFKKVFIIFDDDPQAQVQAKKLRADLNFRGVESIIITIQDDPASMSQKEANKFVNQLLFSEL